MRTLCMLALGVCLLPACIIEGDDDDHNGSYYCGDRSINPPFETCDDGNTLDGDGCSSTCQSEYESFNTFITANWSLRKISNMSTVACPPGYDTAAIYSQPVVDGQPVGTSYIDLYDCSASLGTTAPLPGGEYQSWVEIVNSAGTLTYAKSLSAQLDTRQGDQRFGVSIYVDAGYFQFQWALVGASSNALLTCAQAGAAGGVKLTATVSSTTTAANDLFDCEDGRGITSAYAEGSYTVSAGALDLGNQSAGTAPDQLSKLIQAPNLVTDLGLVTIPITGH